MLSKVIRAIADDNVQVEPTFFECESDECELKKGTFCFGCDKYDALQANNFDLVMNDPSSCKGQGNLQSWKESREYDFRLNEEELTLYKKNGFVVCGRKAVRSFAEAYDRIFSDDMPVYITADSILHAWFLSFYAMKKDLKEHLFHPALVDFLHAVHPAMKDLKQKIESGTYIEKCLKECDKLISVARSFLKEAPAKPVFDENRDFVCNILDAVTDATESKFDIFGESRCLDFQIFHAQTRFSEHKLAPYHRAMYWLGNMVIDLNGRKDNSLLEISCAALLLKLVDAAGILDRKMGVETALQLFIGETQVRGIKELYDIFTAVGVDWKLVSEKEDFENVVTKLAEHFKSDESKDTEKYFGFVPENFSIEAWSLAKESESSYLKTPCSFKHHLKIAKSEGNHSLRTLWFAVLRTLSEPSVHPSEPFHTKAWSYRELTTQMASYTQLRNFSKPLDGCPEEIVTLPQYLEGFVEPRPRFWEAMYDLAKFTSDILKSLPEPKKHKKKTRFKTPGNKCCHCIVSHITNYLETFQNQIEQFWEVSKIQIKIARDGLDQKLKNAWFEKMKINLHHQSGWYGSLFYARVEYAAEPVSVVSGACHKRKGVDKYLRDAVGNVFLCVISVEEGSEVNCYVGPVFSHYQFEQCEPTPITNEQWKKLLESKAEEIDTKPVIAGWCEQYCVPNKDNRDVCIIS